MCFHVIIIVGEEKNKKKEGIRLRSIGSASRFLSQVGKLVSGGNPII